MLVHLGATRDFPVRGLPVNPMQKWLLALVLSACAVGVSYAWLDRPIALYAHANLHGFDVFPAFTRIPEMLKPLVILLFIAVGLWALSGRYIGRLPTVVVLAMASLAVAAEIKDQLKFMFGRTWPETWVRNNPSFIHDGVFGFNPFHGGQAFAAFPSGHATTICAVVSVLWICYPRFRAIYVLAIAAVVLGLIGADFHFLGDVIAGGFLGASIGWVTVELWERGERHVRRARVREATSVPDQTEIEAKHSRREPALS
jgi:membrane-associated phospholipid phosphatase